MKLEVGMYVRTKDGHIDKIIKISDELHNGRTIKVECGEDYCFWGYWDFTDWFSPGHYIKASHNIIDLIEVGDYVNGRLVEMIYDNNEKYLGYKIGSCYIRLGTFDIKSIVTKEQFESMSYKVGDE